MKGIIMAAGKGTRLEPMTKAINKHLLPVYDKPMIFYPLSILMLCKIKEVLIIVNPGEKESFYKLLGDGSQYGIKIEYAVQEKPNGIGQAFIVGGDFIGKSSCALILGDNIFYRDSIQSLLSKSVRNLSGATIFAYHVSDPKRFGIVNFDKKDKPISIEEKPKKPKSSYAVPGLYFYDNTVKKIARKISPSNRGEIEITDINREYLKMKKLKVVKLGRGMAWLDVGMPDSLLDASSFIRTIEKRQGLQIANLDEIAKSLKFI
jgi:glucose-1-phosphate thymidylyltransferase|tara:strand:+ start:1611 stop:2396 length:786 start_codon:yes stop_codon:yes gene_type:complete